LSILETTMPEDRVPETTNSSEPLPDTEALTHLVLERLDTEAAEELPQMVVGWPTGETAAVLAALPQNLRQRFWSLIPKELRGEMLSWLGDQVRSSLLENLEVEEAVAATTSMEPPDLAEIVDDASKELRDAILESLGADERAMVEDTLGYPEACAGRLMEREWVAVRADVRLEVVLRYLHVRGSLPHRTSSLMVVDREGIFLGELTLETLLTQNSDAHVAELMDAAAVSVHALTALDEVAVLFQRRDLVALPVVDDTHRLVGRIVLDDAIHLIRTEAEQPMMHMAGLEVDEDLLAPIASSAMRRMFWLGINLATAFLAAWVIGLFEATLAKIVALAVLMPIVASMGGIAGSQTLTLAIRGLALGQITDANTRWLAIKEITISVINGLVWALVVGLIAWLWFGQLGIALVLGAAMIVNLLVAAASGLAVPLILERLGLDPALSGSVVLTTVTDVVGFLSFLGLATLFLL
jgi:magnesium transporter